MTPVGAQKTAETAVRDLQSAVATGDAAGVLALLPPSYVRDIGGLVNLFAKRMDAETWDRLRQLVYLIATTFEARTNLVINSYAENLELSSEDKDILLRALPALFSEIGKLAQHEITSLERLKSVEGPAIAAELNALFKSAVPMLRFWHFDGEGKVSIQQAIDFKVIRSETIEANVVELTFMWDDGIEQIEEFIQFEGHWIPNDLEELPEMLKNARENLTTIDFTTPEGRQTKESTLKFIGLLEKSIREFARSVNVKHLEEMFEGMFP